MEKIFTLYIHWDPAASALSWNLPLLNRPILWYGIFFALGFSLAYLIFRTLLKEFLSTYQVAREEVFNLAEKVSLYVVIGTLVGARLGDVLFYQNPLLIVYHPLEALKFWEGGLSSHGGIIGILGGIALLCYRIRKKYPMLSFVALLDLLVLPGLFAGGFIRIGNFFNQEILGTATTLPWAIVFGHPADGSLAAPRHPVQLYEALFYFTFFLLIYGMRKRIPKLLRLGKTAGLFFIGTFTFRFLIEFCKAHQSALLAPEGRFDMGQWLSLPMILVGIYLVFGYQNRLSARSVKGD